MSKRTMMGYTYTQLRIALDTSDPDDPHRGNIPINSLDDLDDFT